MKRKKRKDRPVAPELAEVDLELLLKKIGKLIKKKRLERTTIEDFAYEINISRSNLTDSESGSNMNLTTFLKILHGLEISGQDFFKEVQDLK